MKDVVSTGAPESNPAETSAILSERWRLATLGREQLIELGFMSAIIGLLYVLFHLLGNRVEANVSSRSAFTWMLSRWNDNISYGGSADWSFGWLILPVSLVVVWFKRRELIAAPKAVCQWGLAVIVLALAIHWLGAKIQQTRLSLFALILLIWGVPLYFYGWRVGKLLIFPCAYLIFCIPLTFLDTLSFPLRIFVTSVSTHIANMLGIGVYCSGSRILSDTSAGFQFDVADACSGLRSLLAMAALTAVYAHATQKTQIKKWLLFLTFIPLAMVSNSARILSIIISAAAFGEKAAMRIHDWSGYIMFVVAVSLMVGVGVLMNMNYRQQWQRIKGWLLTREGAAEGR
jgi:exosortase